MTTRIGWYVHHHGRGHLTRLQAIAPHLAASGAGIHCFSSLPAPDPLPPRCMWTVLPRDDDPFPAGRTPVEADPAAAGLLHWAPLGHPGHRARLTAIATEVERRPVDAFVVDVSVEVTLLVRLLGIAPVVVTQPGRRNDEPHRLGLRAAHTIIAPWPRGILAPAHLEPFAAKVRHTGGISRFEERAARRTDVVTERDAVAGMDARQRGNGVAVLAGGGGDSLTADEVAAAVAATRRPWQVLGGALGVWADDPWPMLTEAAAVVSWAGQNSVADLAAARAPAVLLPQSRPFDEQHEMAAALQRAGLAVVVDEWPDAAQWPALLHRAMAAEDRWDLWQVPGAAARAAEAILAAADRSR